MFTSSRHIIRVKARSLELLQERGVAVPSTKSSHYEMASCRETGDKRGLSVQIEAYKYLKDAHETKYEPDREADK